MQKTKRLLAIEKIIAEESISTHYQLLKRLKGKGISCTQATLSRNLRQIGAGRVPDGTGGYKYSLGEGFRAPAGNSFKMNVVPAIHDIIEAHGLIIMKTLPGNASNTALLIDGSARYEIAGTIAGDDTILIIPRDGISAQQIHTCLEMILPGVHDQVKKNNTLR
jgi:transcriptional regulator of arginine metabolism